MLRLLSDSNMHIKVAIAKILAKFGEYEYEYYKILKETSLRDSLLEEISISITNSICRFRSIELTLPLIKTLNLLSVDSKTIVNFIFIN